MLASPLFNGRGGIVQNVSQEQYDCGLRAMSAQRLQAFLQLARNSAWLFVDQEDIRPEIQYS
jgi:hypothetical protein